MKRTQPCAISVKEYESLAIWGHDSILRLKIRVQVAVAAAATARILLSE